MSTFYISATCFFRQPWFDLKIFILSYFFVGMRYSILAKVSGPPKLSINISRLKKWHRWSISLGETPPFFRFQVLKLGGSGIITQFGRIPGPCWDEITVIALDLSLWFEVIHISVNYETKRRLQHLHLLVRNFGGVLWSQRIWIPAKFPRIFFCPKHHTHFCLEHGRVFFSRQNQPFERRLRSVSPFFLFNPWNPPEGRCNLTHMFLNQKGEPKVKRFI